MVVMLVDITDSSIYLQFNKNFMQIILGLKPEKGFESKMKRVIE